MKILIADDHEHMRQIIQQTVAHLATEFYEAGDGSEAIAALPPARLSRHGASLVKNYQVPDWFRDAKFGIWAHWMAQCVPEQGDWYARRMYIQGERHYEYHLKTYGHPSKSGFMEIDNLWKAENWGPEKLLDSTKRAGAKYFFALANHHDNFDTYDSSITPGIP